MPLLSRRTGCHLDSLNVFRLKAFRPFDDIKLYSLAFLQAAKAARLNRREMHEHIATTLTADEAVPFGIVKPLYCSLFQWILFLF